LPATGGRLGRVLDEPVVIVARDTATAWLALIEIGFGLVLLIAALTRSHSAILFLGIAVGVAALIAVFEPSVGGGSLAIEREFAVVAATQLGEGGGDQPADVHLAGSDPRCDLRL